MTSAAALALFGWALTYLLHSTILLTVVWAVTRLASDGRLALKEALWKLALVGGLVTASLQPALGIEPISPRFALRAGAEGVVAAAAGAEGAGVAAAGSPRAVGRGGPLLVIGVSPAVAIWLLGGWALIAASALGLIGTRSRRLRHRLRRRPVLAGPALRMLNELSDAAGLRRAPGLTVSGALTSPAVLGRGEICLPDSALREMEVPRLRGVLAHEVAHLSRKDPIWRSVATGIVSLFPFQPLNRVARRELRELAELRCDDWARAITGEPLALARALLDVADRVEVARPGPSPALSLAASAIEVRIRRLLDDSSSRPSNAEGRSVFLLGAVALAGAIWMMPGFSMVGRADTGEAAPTAPVAERRIADGESIPMEIRAVDPAGEFTVSLRGGRVVGASIEGVPVPEDRLVQTADSLRFLGRDGRALFSVHVRPEGGISWEARPADWSAVGTEAT